MSSDSVKFGGTEDISRSPNVQRAIDSTVQIQSHPYYDQTHWATESGNVVALTDAQRKALGVTANDTVVLTDGHGVEDARGNIMVQGSNDKWYAARLLKLDDVRDLAYLKIDNIPPGVLPSVKIADKDDTVTGDTVYSTGHDGWDANITVHGGTVQGVSSKQQAMARLDQIYTKADGIPYNFAGSYERVINGLNANDKADAQADFTRQLLSANTQDKAGMSGGGLFNARGEIIGVLEGTEQDKTLGALSRDAFVPLSQIKAFQAEAPKFTFDYSTMNYKGYTIPSLKEINRTSGEKRIPFNPSDLIEPNVKSQ